MSEVNNLCILLRTSFQFYGRKTKKRGNFKHCLYSIITPTFSQKLFIEGNHPRSLSFRLWVFPVNPTSARKKYISVWPPFSITDIQWQFQIFLWLSKSLKTTFRNVQINKFSKRGIKISDDITIEAIQN